MRSFSRALLIVVVGLGAAFGVFRALGWPSTLEGPRPGGRSIGFSGVQPDELLHAGLGPVRVNGSKEIEIESIRFEGARGIVFESVKVDLSLSVGIVRGESARVDALPAASGFVLQPRQLAQLVVTFRVASEGAYRFAGVRVQYRSGWLSRSVVIGPGVDAFTPGAAPTPTPTPTATAEATAT